MKAIVTKRSTSAHLGDDPVVVLAAARDHFLQLGKALNAVLERAESSEPILRAGYGVKVEIALRGPSGSTSHAIVFNDPADIDAFFQPLISPGGQAAVRNELTALLDSRRLEFRAAETLSGYAQAHADQQRLLEQADQIGLQMCRTVPTTAAGLSLLFELAKEYADPICAPEDGRVDSLLASIQTYVENAGLATAA